MINKESMQLLSQITHVAQCSSRHAQQAYTLKTDHAHPPSLPNQASHTGGLHDCMCLTLGEVVRVLNGLMLMKKAWLLSLVEEAGSKLTVSAVANLWQMNAHPP